MADARLIEAIARALVDEGRLHNRTAREPMTDAEWQDFWCWPANISTRNHYERQARVAIRVIGEWGTTPAVAEPSTQTGE